MEGWEEDQDKEDRWEEEQDKKNGVGRKAGQRGRVERGEERWEEKQDKKDRWEEEQDKKEGLLQFYLLKHKINIKDKSKNQQTKKGPQQPFGRTNEVMTVIINQWCSHV